MNSLKNFFIATSLKTRILFAGALLLALSTVVFSLSLSSPSQRNTQNNTQSPTLIPTSPPARNPLQVNPTNPLPTQLQEKAEHQSAADKLYGELWTDVQKKYPWYDKLPLQTSEYFVYFDLSKKSFIADIYPSTPDQAPFIKRAVTTQLSNLGVDIQNYPIEWKVQ